MDTDITFVEMKDEFKICPSCGYEDGFHSMFKRDGKIVRWYFICPACRKVYDIGLTAGDSAEQ